MTFFLNWKKRKKTPEVVLQWFWALKKTTFCVNRLSLYSICLSARRLTFYSILVHGCVYLCMVLPIQHTVYTLLMNALVFFSLSKVTLTLHYISWTLKSKCTKTVIFFKFLFIVLFYYSLNVGIYWKQWVATLIQIRTLIHALLSDCEGEKYMCLYSRAVLNYSLLSESSDTPLDLNSVQHLMCNQQVTQTDRQNTHTDTLTHSNASGRILDTPELVAREGTKQVWMITNSTAR